MLSELLSTIPTVPIFVQGQRGAGKAAAVSDALRQASTRWRVVRVDCSGCFTPRLLYETVLSQLPPPPGASTLWQACSGGLPQFLSSLRLACGASKEPVALVLSNAERLCALDAAVLPAIVRLPELLRAAATGVQDTRAPRGALAVVLVSSVEWRFFRDTVGGTGAPDPTVVHVAPYTQLDLAAKLESQLMAEAEEQQPWTRTVVRLFLEVIFPVCNDAHELRRLLRVVLPRASADIENAGLRPTEPLDASSQRALEVKWQEATLPSLKTAKKHHFYAQHDASETSLASVFELPLLSKYLLLAGFIASCNSDRTDKQAFTSSGRARRQRTSTVQQQGALIGKHRQPHAFPLARLLAIFSSITANSTQGQVMEAQLLVQVSTLVHLGLLVRPNRGDVRFEALKYTSNLRPDTARALALQLDDFELADYLT